MVHLCGRVSRLTEFALAVFIWKNVGIANIFQKRNVVMQSTICGAFGSLAREKFPFLHSAKGEFFNRTPFFRISIESGCSFTNVSNHQIDFCTIIPNESIDLLSFNRTALRKQYFRLGLNPKCWKMHKQFEIYFWPQIVKIDSLMCRGICCYQQNVGPSFRKHFERRAGP